MGLLAGSVLFGGNSWLSLIQLEIAFATPISEHCVAAQIQAQRERGSFLGLAPQGTCERDFWQYEVYSLTDQGHGRTVHYMNESTTALNHYLDLPDVALLARRTCSARNHHTRDLTGLSPSRVSLPHGRGSAGRPSLHAPASSQSLPGLA